MLSVNMSNDLLVLKDGQPVAFERSAVSADLKGTITVSIGNGPGTGTAWAVTSVTTM